MAHHSPNKKRPFRLANKRDAIIKDNLKRTLDGFRLQLDARVQTGELRSACHYVSACGLSRLKLSTGFDSFRVINIDSQVYRSIRFSGRVKTHNDAKKTRIIPPDRHVFGAHSEQKSWRVDSATKDKQAELLASMPQVSLHVCTIEDCSKLIWQCDNCRLAIELNVLTGECFDCNQCVREYICKKRTSFFIHLMLMPYRFTIKDSNGNDVIVVSKGYSQGDKRYSQNTLVKTRKGSYKLTRKLTAKDTLLARPVNQGSHPLASIYDEKGTFGLQLAKDKQDKRKEKLMWRRIERSNRAYLECRAEIIRLVCYFI